MSSIPLISSDILNTLSGTVAVDAGGAPLMLHHGTYVRFDKFDLARTQDIGFHFGTYPQANKRLVDLGRRGIGRFSKLPNFVPYGTVLAVALAVKNPAMLNEDPASWMPNTVIKALGDKITLAFAAEIAELSRRFLGEDARVEQREALVRYKEKHRKEAGPRTSSAIWEEITSRRQGIVLARIREHLQGLGYDAIAYPNEYETPGRSKGQYDYSWCVFNPEQIIVLGEELKTVEVLPVTADDLREAGFKPGVNPTLVPYDPMMKRGLITRQQSSAFMSAIKERMERLDATRIPSPFGIRDWTDWEISLGEGSLRIHAHKSGFVTIGAEGLADEEVADLISRIDIPLASGDSASPRGWRLNWEAGQTLADFMARADALIEQIECQILRPSIVLKVA